jgi:hypothetical protein
MPVTVITARAHLQEHLEEGTTCPVCDQYARQYCRNLSSAMAGCLIWLVQRWNANGHRWISPMRKAPRRFITSYSLAKHWGLIHERPNDNPEVGRSGLWKPTKLGRKFALNQVKVPKYVYLYNNEVLDFSEERINIFEALSTHFNYEELMQGKWPT